MTQFDPMHPGMYTPPGTGSSQAIPANPPPIRPIPPGGLPGQRPVAPETYDDNMAYMGGNSLNGLAVNSGAMPQASPPKMRVGSWRGLA